MAESTQSTGMRIQTRPPLSPSQQGIFYKYSFSWVFKYYWSNDKKAAEAKITEILPETSRYERSVAMSTVHNPNLYYEILSHIKWDMMKVIVMVFLKKIADMIVISRMYWMSKKVNDGEGSISVLLQTLPFIYFLDLFSIMMLAFSEIKSEEIGLSSRNLINSMVYKKILRFQLVYNKDYSESQLIGLMQTDSAQINNLYNIIKNYIEGTMNIVIFAVWGAFYFGSTITVLIVVFIILQLLSIWCTWLLADIQVDYLKFKDQRMKQLKSALNCLPLIKLFGLENVMFIKIMKERAKEIESFVGISIQRSWVSLFSWCSVYVAFVLMVIFMFIRDQPLEYVSVVPITKMMMLLFYSTGLIPRATENVLNLRVSMDRIVKFLNKPEIADFRSVASRKESSNDEKFVTPKKENKEEEMIEMKPIRRKEPLVVQRCNFLWQPTASNTDTNATKDGKQVKEPSKDLAVSVKSETKTNAPFNLTNISIHLVPGEFAVVVGKVGSGKSSLLYALFNEMRMEPYIPTPQDGQEEVSPSSFLAPVKNIPGSIIYLGQKPWILNKSIKDNIILSKPFVEEDFRKALKAAQMLEEVEAMPLKEDTSAGKKGEKLSGGQRWRLALARAFYQE